MNINNNQLEIKKENMQQIEKNNGKTHIDVKDVVVDAPADKVGEKSGNKKNDYKADSVEKEIIKKISDSNRGKKRTIEQKKRIKFSKKRCASSKKGHQKLLTSR